MIVYLILRRKRENDAASAAPEQVEMKQRIQETSI